MANIEFSKTFQMCVIVVRAPVQPHVIVNAAGQILELEKEQKPHKTWNGTIFFL